jgi:hypothetical protein
MAKTKPYKASTIRIERARNFIVVSSLAGIAIHTCRQTFAGVYNKRVK